MYKLLRIYNIKCNENEVLSAQYEVMHEFKTFTMTNKQNVKIQMRLIPL